MKLNPIRKARYLKTKILRKIKFLYNDVNDYVDEFQDKINYDYLSDKVAQINDLRIKLRVTEYVYQPGSYLLVGASIAGASYGIYKGLEAIL